MPTLTPEGQAKLAEIAARHGVSTDAAAALLAALIRGGGTMAQFDHPELGGSGQWMQGGMTMVGDMFNTALKAKVDALCRDLAQLLASHPPQPAEPPRAGQTQSQRQGPGGAGGVSGGGGGDPSLFIPADAGAGRWWPAQLGSPDAAGSQNQVRYAYFAGPRRLAIEFAGQVTVYDTADHRITGVSQQQDAAGTSITFTSQKGRIPLSSLRVVSDAPDPGGTHNAGGSHNPGGTGPSGTGPSGTGPSGTGPSGTGPSGTGPSGTGPSGTGPGGTGRQTQAQRGGPPEAGGGSSAGPAAAPPSSTESGAGGFIAESLAGSVWRLGEAGGALLGEEIRLEADGTITGSTPLGLRYWAVEDDVLWLYNADGWPLARFAALDPEAALPTLLGHSPQDPAVAYVLIAPAPQTDRLAAVDGETVTLGLRIPLTEATWRLSDAGGTVIARLRLLPDGRIEGGTRPSEAGWRVEDNRLLLLHKSGRPTARFDTFRIGDGGWSLRGTQLSNGAELVMVQGYG